MDGIARSRIWADIRYYYLHICNTDASGDISYPVYYCCPLAAGCSENSVDPRSVSKWLPFHCPNSEVLPGSAPGRAPIVLC